MKWTFGFLTVVILSALSSAHASSQCEIKMINSAQYTFANELSRSVSNVKVAQFVSGPWTASVANNVGGAEVIVYTNSKSFGLFNVTAQQIGSSADCKITSVARSTRPIEGIRAQALRYKLAIRDALYISEGDAEWDMFYTEAKVRENFTKTDIASVLGTDEPVELYTSEEAMEVLTSYTSREDATYPEHVYLYENLIKEFKKDFTSLRAVKVGQPDSGSLRLYVFGRLPDGRLVGLSTISVET